MRRAVRCGAMRSLEPHPDPDQVALLRQGNWQGHSGFTSRSVSVMSVLSTEVATPSERSKVLRLGDDKA